MTSPALTAILQVYYPERAKYLPRIIDALMAGTLAPSKIIVWDNNAGRDPDDLNIGRYPRLTLISSWKNTLMGRYAAILMCGTEYVFVQDDDLAVGKDTVRALVERAKETHRICGTAGVRLTERAGEPYEGKPYTLGRWMAEGRVDVVLGRCWAAPRHALIPGITAVLQGVEPTRCDDILFSMASGGGWVVLNIGDVQITDLPEEGIGLCHSPQHLHERDAFALRLLRELALK